VLNDEACCPPDHGQHEHRIESPGKRLEDFRRIREHLYFFNRATCVRSGNEGLRVLKTESIGHSFEFKLLASRIRAVMPAIGAPIEWLLDVFPFLKRRTIYVNPAPSSSHTRGNAAIRANARSR